MALGVPCAIVARIVDPAPERDGIDQAIEDLLNDDRDDRPHEDESGKAE
ncbi:MAG: hypothetical protein QOD27_2194 [Microbacteriaceae bacterium]|nr:hypothetical protein [Microbacteriaceae bacterium]